MIALALAAVIVGTIGSALGPEPATAAEGGLEFSRDGVTWSATPPAALFESVPVLVPGGGRTASLHIRNGHEGATRISAFVTDLTWSSAAAAEVFELSAVDGRGGAFPDTGIGAIPDCTSLIPQRVLGSGQSIQLAVTVRMPHELTDDRGANESMGFALALGLTDPVVPELETCPREAIAVPAIPSTSTGAASGSRTGFGSAEPAADATAEPEPAAPDEVEPTPVEAAAEWVSCDLRAFASGMGMPVALCPDILVSDGAASALMLLFLLISIIWFLLLWRRRRRDEEEDAHELHGGGVA